MEEGLPAKALRQSVLSLPFAFLQATDPESALHLNIHFHMLVLDRAYLIEMQPNARAFWLAMRAVETVDFLTARWARLPDIRFRRRKWRTVPRRRPSIETDPYRAPVPGRA